jgi:hypothetical protein
MPTAQKHIVKITWDQSTSQHVVTIDGRPVPHVKRSYVDTRTHDCEIHLVLDGADFEIETTTDNTEIERYTGG